MNSRPDSLIPDSAARTAPPAGHGRAFSALTRREQLDILARLYERRIPYADGIVEAVAESRQSDAFLKAALDADIDDADVGRRLRELLITYVEAIATRRGDDLTELS